MDNIILWQSVLSRLEEKLSRPTFATWFRDTNIKSLEEDEVIISVPNIFVREWLQNKFEQELLFSFRQLSPKVRRIKYAISGRKETTGKSGTNEIDFAQQKIDFYQNRLSGLNPRYTFSTFVVGNFNQLAHACAVSITKRILDSSFLKGFPFKKSRLEYNPLFIYSKVGLGKTHLLEAIGNEIVNAKKKKKVKYIPCPTFTSEVISTIRDGSIEKLVKSYSQFDVLIIDDIGFIAGKERTQEVFFRIFNDLTENGKQIILSSDRPPQAIEKLEERLRSRFEGGMVVDISFPEFEERLAILEEKLEEREAFLPKELLEFITINVKKNIRELEGVLVKALVIFEREKSAERVKENLRDIIEEPKKRISPNKIIENVCDFYNVTRKEILSKSRKKELVSPRQIIMHFLREELALSLPSIGVKLGNKDHTTVGYSCEKVEEKLKKDADFAKEIDVIREKIYNG
ncbi:MAG: chromosomal replication initiator protein DnaA [Patescibacteria group bacterium]